MHEVAVFQMIDALHTLAFLRCHHHIPSNPPIRHTLSHWYMESKIDLLLSRAESLADQFKREHRRHVINVAIMLARLALELCSPEHPMRASSVTDLSIYLSDRYEQFGNMRDIQEGISLSRAVLQLCPTHTKSEKVWKLLSRGNSLRNQFRREGGRHLIDKAIAIARLALELCLANHPLRAASLTLLSVYLWDRYDQFGNMKDIEAGILLDRAALRLYPMGHPFRYIPLGNLARGLSTRYDRLGETEDLDQAIFLEQEELQVLRPPGHHSRPITLSNLGNNLCKRYQKLGVMEDLDEGISCSRDSLALCPQEYPDRSNFLNILATGLQCRYNKLGEMHDLDEAIVMNREALDLCPQGNSGRSYSLSNLSIRLFARYRKLGNVIDLDDAIALKRQAVELRPLGHPIRSEALIGLSSGLHERYKKLGKTDDLKEAIVLDIEAVKLCPVGHPERSRSLENFAIHFLSCLRRSRRSSIKNKINTIFSVYTQIAAVSHTVWSADLSAAKHWIAVAEAFKHSTTVLAYETYFRLLSHHLAALPSLSRHLNIIKDLASSLAQDAFSAAVRNRSPTKAIELLEQGRVVFLSQLGRLRSPVDDVVAFGPEGKTLGEKFMRLTLDVRKALTSSRADQHGYICHLNVELQRVVSKIRNLPGFSHFLLSPLFPHLRKAAIYGPVVIVNASKYGCDALVVFFDRDPIHLPLQITIDEVRSLSRELKRLTNHRNRESIGRPLEGIMRGLWDKVVSRIVDVLKVNHPLQSRIWWCPTAEFSVLPLHAAGTYRKGQPTFSDFYVSSYTSSLATLIQARQHQSSSSPAEWKRVVGIGQAKAPGQSELHSIADELTAIGETVDRHAVFTRTEGSASTVDSVLEALRQNEWVHFACHGLPNRERPFESAFVLYDGYLTVERLLHCDLRKAEFAYLSACYTTVGDEDCLDETIHLASAMQFAGFRSVIGTMWAVDDGEQTVKITSRFYEKMVDGSGRLDHARAAYALHETTRELQSLSFDQRILYVHFGA